MIPFPESIAEVSLLAARVNSFPYRIGNAQVDDHIGVDIEVAFLGILCLIGRSNGDLDKVIRRTFRFRTIGLCRIDVVINNDRYFQLVNTTILIKHHQLCLSRLVFRMCL